jgi:hypothetical protein
MTAHGYKPYSKQSRDKLREDVTPQVQDDCYATSQDSEVIHGAGPSLCRRTNSSIASYEDKESIPGAVSPVGRRITCVSVPSTGVMACQDTGNFVTKEIVPDSVPTVDSIFSVDNKITPGTVVSVCEGGKRLTLVNCISWAEGLALALRWTLMTMMSEVRLVFSPAFA